MNRLDAVVTALESEERLSIVSFLSGDTPLRMMALELGFELAPGSVAVLGCKASNVAIAKGLEGGLSISNRLTCKVESLEKGAVLCRVLLRFGTTLLESIITRTSAESMALQEGETVQALIKASELSILEVRS